MYTFAMYSDRAFRRFRYPYKPIDYQIWWYGTIHEEQLSMFKPMWCKLPRIIRFLIKPDDSGDPVRSEVLVIVFGAVEGIPAV